MPETQIRSPSPDDEEFYSQLLTTIDRRARRRFTESSEAGNRAVRDLNNFIAELQSTAHSLEGTCPDIYADQPAGSVSPSSLMTDYLEPRLLAGEPCEGFTDRENQASSPSSMYLTSFTSDNMPNLPRQPSADVDADLFSPVTTINPSLLSNFDVVAPVQSSSISQVSNLEEGVCIQNSLHRPNHCPPPSLIKRKTKSMATSTHSSLKERYESNTAPPTPSGICPELSPVVAKLIQSIGSIASIIQLKESLEAVRRQLIASSMAPPQSTKEIWTRLDLLDCNTHTNNIQHRICLVQLNSRRNELRSSIRGERKKASTLVIDKIAEDAEERNREKVMNRLHAATVWGRISDEFSTGVLALIPTGKAQWPSNTAVEKMKIVELDGFLNENENDRHGFIKRAAHKVAEVMPIFEGKSCDTLLKVEKVGIEELGNIQDELAILELLDSL